MIIGQNTEAKMMATVSTVVWMQKPQTQLKERPMLGSQLVSQLLKGKTILMWSSGACIKS